jgi:hypothetical protein
MTPQERQELMDRLEAIVDAAGMDETLRMLGEICNLKADHLRSNWQDEASAKWFEKIARRLGKVGGAQ